jgi:hypothetical protein
MACVAAAAAGFFWQPVAANPKTTNTASEKMRFKTIVLARSLLFSLKFCSKALP